SDTIERLQAEMRTAQAKEPPPAPRVVDQARATPQAVLGDWWSGSWPIFAALVGLASLIAAGLGWKWRKTNTGATMWPAFITQQSKTELAPLKHADDAAPAAIASASVPAAVAENAMVTPSPEHVATRIPVKQSPAPLRMVKDNTVAVSELSHVTEEA